MTAVTVRGPHLVGFTLLYAVLGGDRHRAHVRTAARRGPGPRNRPGRARQESAAPTLRLLSRPSLSADRWSHALNTALVRPDRGAVDRLLRARGFRLRRRHAAAAARPRRRRPPRAHQHDRPGLGRQRGLADRRPAARCSPPSRSGTPRCSAASTSRCSSILVALIVRGVASSSGASGTAPGWRAGWDVVHLRGQPGARAAAGAWPSPTCVHGRAARRSTGTVPGALLRPADPRTRCRRAGQPDRVPDARRDVPDP